MNFARIQNDKPRWDIVRAELGLFVPAREEQE